MLSELTAAIVLDSRSCTSANETEPETMHVVMVRRIANGLVGLARPGSRRAMECMECGERLTLRQRGRRAVNIQRWARGRGVMAGRGVAQRVGQVGDRGAAGSRVCRSSIWGARASRFACCVSQ